MRMVPRLQELKARLPPWVQDWLDFIVPSTQILLILLAAWVLQYLLRRLVRRATVRYQLPSKLLAPLTGLIRWLVMGSALLLVLERLGVSATVLWTAFTGFATVGAVAFFAAWSVLSNLFCALLILTVRPFRVGDHIEVIDTAEKTGAKGQVVDINLLYTTLLDHDVAQGHPCWLQIPNTLIFQRVVRRWQGVPPAPPPPPPPGPEPTAETTTTPPAALASPMP